MREIHPTLSAGATEWQSFKDEDVDDADTASPQQEDPPGQDPSGG